MDAQTFLHNFAAIADSPGGVQRLRELVLRLAFRGFLTSHDDGEHALLASLTAASSPQRPFPIPPQWGWATFADVTDSRLGKMLDKAKNTGPMRPYLRNANVQWFRFDLSDVHQLRLEERDLDAHTVRRGDLIICEGGEPGRVAICDKSVEGMVIQKALHRSRPKAGIDPLFLAYLLRCFSSSGYLSTFFTGATIKHLTGKALAAVPVPLPSHAEQQRIVAKVEELMVLCDDLEARQGRRHCATTHFRVSALHTLTEAETPDDLRHAWDRLDGSWPSVTGAADSVPHLRQAVLRLAVEGRLVPQDPTVEDPAQTLLDQLTERRGFAGVALPPGKRPELPAGWAWASFGQATVNRDAERIPLKRADRSQRPGQFDYYGASGVIDQINDYIFDGDFLLIGEDGANLVLRSTPIAFITTGRFWVNNHAHVLESVELDALKYLAIFINSIDLRPYLTGIAQPKLNQARMNRIPVPLPPLAEQRRIVERVDQLVRMCDELACALIGQESRQLDLAEASCHSIM